MSENLDRLDSIDLSQLTIGEIRAMKNTILRNALLEAISAIGQPTAHYSHGQHSNHYKTIAGGLREDLTTLPR